MKREIRRVQDYWTDTDTGHRLDKVFFDGGDWCLRAQIMGILPDKTKVVEEEIFIDDLMQIELLESFIAIIQYGDGKMVGFFNRLIGNLGKPRSGGPSIDMARKQQHRVLQKATKIAQGKRRGRPPKSVEPKKRGPGRPPGSKNKVTLEVKKRKKRRKVAA